MSTCERLRLCSGRVDAQIDWNLRLTHMSLVPYAGYRLKQETCSVVQFMEVI